MRKIPAVLAVSALAALTLAGCAPAGSATSDGCTRSATAESETLDLITVSGEFGERPEVKMYTPLVADATEYRDEVAGDGNAIVTPSQSVVLDVTLFDGETGEELIATAYDGDLSRVAALSQWEQSFPGIADFLDCATEGSRVVVALPPDGLTEAQAEQLGLTADQSTVAVVDVRKVYLSKADGADQFVEGHGLPTVVRAPDGTPGVIIPDATPPDDVVVRLLKKGDGEVVTADAPVRIHYTGLTWENPNPGKPRKPFDSSWERGAPESVSLEGVVEGFAQALEGQTVGSQILAVIPPDAGYGDQEQAGIPAGSTLVFVIDILGVDAAPAE
ncbi:MAG TPA: FKBP-type peptidyl-prolyl cis-trans isomerase [Microbacterium sp.]|uniref:FKBP-type peptidyl-prolyl cis-trans isomerase n=1 Tax=Microbacterium sp. TaxID=51671 RepID=UPI002BEAA93B|nr:FKBP-type peptidyl-prolyl cis-trans isomerase [Microbacterium sp.]HWI32434.1 FKBP-type peptidyl-prolyl cis-trans isomerase [Microbacterium sp.]